MKQGLFVCRAKQGATFDNHVSAPLIRKSFAIEKLPDSALLKISGLGFYKLMVNGKDITKGFLAPYISNPDEVVYYDEYDISELLNIGKNVIAVVLGNGFQNAMDNNLWFFQQARWLSAPKLALTLEIDNKIFLTSDETFKCTDSPITYDDLRSGVRYDARREIAGWATAEFDDSAWDNVIVADQPLGELKLCNADPIKAYEEITPVKITANSKGYLYDFGEVNAGVCRLKINGNEGQVISLTHGEIEIDGELDLANITFWERSRSGYVQHDVYICKEGEQTYTPDFTYHGFRYVQVSGITDSQANKDLLTYIVLHSDILPVGKFSCSNEIVNKIQDCTLRSDKSNFHYFPTDCPQREKNGWTGDAVLSAEQLLYNFKCERSLKEWLFMVRKAQKPDGSLPGIVPTAGWGYEWGSGPAWDNVIVEVPLQIYRFEGDLEVLLANSDAIFAYLKYMQTKLNPEGLAAYGLGDWCEAGTASEDRYSTPLEITDTITCYSICINAAYIFGEIGQKDRQDFAFKCAEKLKKAFVSKYFAKEYMEQPTQTGLAMSIHYGLIEGAMADKSYADLIDLIKKDNNHFRVGVLGGRVLFDLLCERGDSALALKLIAQNSFPSYGYHVARGATTLWEGFHELDDSKPYLMRKDGVPRLLSLNHHFWGFVSGTFYKYFAGLNVVSNNEVRISPCFDCGLEHAEAKVALRNNGIAKVAWIKNQDYINLSIEVDDGILTTMDLKENYKIISKDKAGNKNIYTLRQQ